MEPRTVIETQHTNRTRPEMAVCASTISHKFLIESYTSPSVKIA